MKQVRKKVKPGSIVLVAATFILAVLFIYPVLFALMSAFKSNGDILKNPIAFPASLYIQNFQDLFAQSDFVGAIINSVFLTVVSELLIVCIVPWQRMGLKEEKAEQQLLFTRIFWQG